LISRHKQADFNAWTDWL